MIIWINGPFGVGKTTLANQLNQQLPNSLVFDPELLGSVLHHTLPDLRGQDFQEFALWRESVIQYALGLKTHFKRHLIIPMTLLKPVSISEIFDALRKSSTRIFHFYLDIETEELIRRIEKDLTSGDSTLKWRTQSLEKYAIAKSDMPKETIFLKAGKKDPITLSSEILKHIQS